MKLQKHIKSKEGKLLVKAVSEDCISIIIREILDAAGLKEIEINMRITKTFHKKLAVLLTKGKKAGKKVVHP